MWMIPEIKKDFPMYGVLIYVCIKTFRFSLIRVIQFVSVLSLKTSL